ncbi:unnamed protein product [Hermetia illucens]|uniref:LRRNT domain-containing protein n=2 Tax=Hermetia illucens TaxID=343691 RepID=A0A7R8UHA8_HERIL|nr:unnamed protein product [Hermetia illucens]
MLALVFFVAALIGPSVGLPCPRGCTCEQGRVRCINVHLSAIPAVPSDTIVLDLRFNQIRALPTNAFAGFPNLSTIFLSENRIGIIHDDAFAGLSHLRNLYLNDNRISKISADAFRGLPQLQNL